MRIRAYSLFELVLTVAVVGIVLAAGIPSFADVLSKHRQRVELDALFHAMHLAKKASVVRNTVVSVCASDDLEQCEPRTDWSSGWIIFVNDDRDSPASVDAGEIVLRRHAVDERVQLRSNRRAYSFRSTQRRASNGTIVACDRTGRVEPRAVVISYTGRPRLASRNRRRSPYDCEG